MVNHGGQSGRLKTPRNHVTNNFEKPPNLVTLWHLLTSFDSAVALQPMELICIDPSVCLEMWQLPNNNCLLYIPCCCWSWKRLLAAANGWYDLLQRTCLCFLKMIIWTNLGTILKNAISCDGENCRKWICSANLFQQIFFVDSKWFWLKLETSFNSFQNFEGVWSNKTFPVTGLVNYS